MKIDYIQTVEVPEATTFSINRIAAAGFGQDESTMLEDTLAHVRSADTAQLVSEHGNLLAFGLYTRCLWQPCN